MSTRCAFWLAAATNGRAKNYWSFLQPGDAYVMTPLCDILAMWSYFGVGPNQCNRRQAGFAMAMRSKDGHYHFNTNQTRHWYQLARNSGGPVVWDAMVGLVERVGPALARGRVAFAEEVPRQVLAISPSRRAWWPRPSGSWSRPMGSDVIASLRDFPRRFWALLSGKAG